MIGRSHRSHAAAHASVGMTWLLNSAAATDARHRTSPCRHDMAILRSHCKISSNRTDPKNPNVFGKVRVFSVRERKIEIGGMAAVLLDTQFQVPIL